MLTKQHRFKSFFFITTACTKEFKDLKKLNYIFKLVVHTLNLKKIAFLLKKQKSYMNIYSQGCVKYLNFWPILKKKV